MYLTKSWFRTTYGSARDVVCEIQDSHCGRHLELSRKYRIFYFISFNLFTLITRICVYFLSLYIIYWSSERKICRKNEPDLQDATEPKKSYSLPELMKRGFLYPDIMKGIVPSSRPQLKKPSE